MILFFITYITSRAFIFIKAIRTRAYDNARLKINVPRIERRGAVREKRSEINFRMRETGGGREREKERAARGAEGRTRGVVSVRRAPRG